MNVNDYSVAITLLGAGGGPANETLEVNVANSVLYAYVQLNSNTPPKKSFAKLGIEYGFLQAGSVDRL